MTRRKDGSWEEDIQCVVDSAPGKGAIFISNIQAASNPKTLAKHGIGAVITCCKGKNMAETMPKHIEYLYIPAVDHQTFDLTPFFKVTTEMLGEELERTNVLVHCIAGVSRSATVVMAFLMKTRGITFQQAHRLVKSRRPIIHPNSSFIEQLERYEKSLAPVKSVAKPTGKAGWEEKSTTTSWYSPPAPPTVQPSRQAGLIRNSSVPTLNSGSYDNRLRQQIRSLMSNKAKGKVGC